MADRQQELDTLNTRMAEECECALKATAIQAVPGDGSASAEIVFIGEAPGKNEDEQGRPFVGAAGKFLSEMLESIGLRREDVYITNVVKYRPPGNRDPLPTEVESCWPWLRAQLEVIRPALVVLLGRHAMERFLPGMKISQVHGQAFRRDVPELGTYVFYTLYHPAAALYNGSMRDVLKKDFRRIPKVVEKVKKQSE